MNATTNKTVNNKNNISGMLSKFAIRVVLTRIEYHYPSCCTINIIYMYMYVHVYTYTNTCIILHKICLAVNCNNYFAGVIILLYCLPMDQRRDQNTDKI